MLIAIRGATTIEHDRKEEIVFRTNELLSQMFAQNTIDGKCRQCAAIIIGTTADIHSFYPAKAIRENGLIDVPLFSTTEPDIENALPMCIRILVLVNAKRFDRRKNSVQHIYLHGAVVLRPDLVGSKNEGEYNEYSH